MKTTKSAWMYCFLLNSSYYIGLANIVQSPTNQTACTGALAVFTCVSSNLNTISWQINSLNPIQWNISNPSTTPLPQGSGVTSTLMLPSISTFAGTSVVCYDGQDSTLPAFLRILGSSSPPVLMTFPFNSTSIRIHWTFGSDNVSTLSYYVTIINMSGAVMYNESLNDAELIYTPPDTCDRYSAVVTAMYGYFNFTCLQNSSVQIVGAYPTTPLIPANMFHDCSSMSPDNLNIDISVLPQQDVCSYEIETSWVSFTTQSSPYPKQSIFNVSLPFNQLINLTVVAFNPYGSSSSSVNISTYEIVNITINATYPFGRWTADCVFISCSQSIGCLVYLNDTHCAAFKRGLNNSMNVSCPVQSNDSFPGPGGYVVKAYAVHVLSNGSIYRPLAYTEFRVLMNQALTTLTTQVIGTQPDVPVIVGAVFGAVIGIVMVIIIVVVIWIFRKKGHYNTSNLCATQRSKGTDHEMDEIHETERNKLLLGAAKDGNAEQFNYLFETSDLELKNEHEQTLLMLASENGHVKVVQKLLSAHARVDLQDMHKQSSLMLASRKGHLEIVQILISHNATVDLQDEYKNTALHEAAKYGHTDCVEYLVEKKADVNSLSVSGRTPLHQAVVNGHTEVVELLLKMPSVKVNCPNVVGGTPLMTAVMNGWVKIVELILEKSPNHCTSDQLGYTALHWAASCGHYDVMNILLKKSSIDINIRNKDGETPMDLAQHRNDNKMLGILMNCKRKVSKEAVKTVHHNSDESTEFGVSVNTTGRIGIHQCAINGDAQQLKQLIQLNPDIVNMKDAGGKTPLHYAAFYGFIPCLSLLIDVANIDANCQDKNGSTPLHLAAQSGIAVCVQKLLLHKDIKEEMKPDNDGNFAYHVAAMYCRLACLKVFKSIFIGKGKDDNTILHYATEIGWLDGVRYILNEGNAKSIVNCQNKSGNTPLHLATLKGHVKIVKVLLDSSNIKMEELNNNGKSAVDVAQENEEEVITTLVKYQQEVQSQQCTKGDAKIFCGSVKTVTADNKIGDCYKVSTAVGSHNISISIPSSVLSNKIEIHITVGSIKSAMNKLFELPPDVSLVSPIIWVFVSPEIKLQESIEITLPFTSNDIIPTKTNIRFGTALYNNDTLQEMFKFEIKTSVMVEDHRGVFKTNQLCCCFGLLFFADDNELYNSCS